LTPTTPAQKGDCLRALAWNAEGMAGIGCGAHPSRIWARTKPNRRTTMSEIRKKLIAAGVKNLKAFGYPEVNADSILTDAIYKAFFHSMLEDNQGKGGAQADAAITELLKETA
jgi:hypothetical protein